MDKPKEEPDEMNFDGVDPSHVQKSQVKTAVGIVAAILILQPVKDFFFTRDEAKGHLQRIEKIETMIHQNQEETVRRLERVTDKIIARINEAETRVAKSQEEFKHTIERRVERLEATQVTDSNRKRGREWN